MPKINDIRAAVAEAGSGAPVGDEKTPAEETVDETEAGDEAAPEEAKPKRGRKPKAAASVAVTESSDDESEPEEKRKYRVSLVYNPELIVEAADRLGAIEAYNEKCGILSTIHKHKVSKA